MIAINSNLTFDNESFFKGKYIIGWKSVGRKFDSEVIVFFGFFYKSLDFKCIDNSQKGDITTVWFSGTGRGRISQGVAHANVTIFFYQMVYLMNPFTFKIIRSYQDGACLQARIQGGGGGPGVRPPPLKLSK